MTRTELNLSPHTRKILSLLIMMGCGLAALWFINTQQWLAWDFRNNLWGPTYLLVHGQSPYQVELLFDNSRAVWFPMIIGLCFPLGFLTQYQATNIWFMVNLLAIFGLVRLAPPKEKFSLPLTIICLIAIFLFPPTVAHFRLGQLSIVITLILLAITEIHSTPKIAFLLAVSLSKPQLNIFVLPGLLLAYTKQHGWRKTLILIGYLGMGVILLTLPLFMADPFWLQSFFAAQHSNPIWLQPSSFVLLQINYGIMGLILWGLIALIGMGLNVWLWLRQPQKTAMLWSLAITPLITPYVWSWDFVLMYPLLIHTAFSLNSKRSQLFLLICYMICWTLILRIELNHNITNERFWWVSWFLMAIIISSHFWQNYSTCKFSGDSHGVQSRRL